MPRINSSNPPLFAALILLFFTSIQNASAEDSRRRISVVGTAVTKVAPDTVVWNISSTRSGKTLGSAKAKSDKEMQSILATVKALGVESKDIQTGYLKVQKEYNRDKYGNYTQFKGYELHRQISVKERDTSKFDAFLAALLKSGKVEVSYHLESSKIVKIRASTRLKSVAAAKEKARAMAKVLDGKLGAPLTIEEDSFNPSHMTNYRHLNSATLDSSGNAGSGTFEPGTIDVRASVKVVFELQ